MFSSDLAENTAFPEINELVNKAVIDLELVPEAIKQLQNIDNSLEVAPIISGYRQKLYQAVFENINTQLPSDLNIILSDEDYFTKLKLLHNIEADLLSASFIEEDRKNYSENIRGFKARIYNRLLKRKYSTEIQKENISYYLDALNYLFIESTRIMQAQDRIEFTVLVNCYHTIDINLDKLKKSLEKIDDQALNKKAEGTLRLLTLTHAKFLPIIKEKSFVEIEKVCDIENASKSFLFLLKRLFHYRKNIFYSKMKQKKEETFFLLDYLQIFVFALDRYNSKLITPDSNIDIAEILFTKFEELYLDLKSHLLLIRSSADQSNSSELALELKYLQIKSFLSQNKYKSEYEELLNSPSAEIKSMRLISCLEEFEDIIEELEEYQESDNPFILRECEAIAHHLALSLYKIWSIAKNNALSNKILAKAWSEIENKNRGNLEFSSNQVHSIKNLLDVPSAIFEYLEKFSGIFTKMQALSKQPEILKLVYDEINFKAIKKGYMLAQNEVIEHDKNKRKHEKNVRDKNSKLKKLKEIQNTLNQAEQPEQREKKDSKTHAGTEESQEQSSNTTSTKVSKNKTKRLRKKRKKQLQTANSSNPSFMETNSVQALSQIEPVENHLDVKEAEENVNSLSYDSDSSKENYSPIPSPVSSPSPELESQEENASQESEIIYLSEERHSILKALIEQLSYLRHKQDDLLRKETNIEAIQEFSDKNNQEEKLLNDYCELISKFSSVFLLLSTYQDHLSGIELLTLINVVSIRFRLIPPIYKHDIYFLAKAGLQLETRLRKTGHEKIARDDLPTLSSMGNTFGFLKLGLNGSEQETCNALESQFNEIRTEAKSVIQEFYAPSSDTNPKF